MKKIIILLGILFLVMSCREHNCHCYGDKYQSRVKKGLSGNKLIRPWNFTAYPRFRRINPDISCECNSHAVNSKDEKSWIK